MRIPVPSRVGVMVALLCLLALVVFFATEMSAGSVEAAVTRAQHEQPGSFRILATAPWERGQVIEYTYRIEGQQTPQIGLAITERHVWLINNVVASGGLTGVTHDGVHFWESCANSWCYAAGTARGRSQIQVHGGKVVRVHHGLFAYRTHNRQQLP